MFKHIDHLAIHVADVPAAARSYADLFGFETISEHTGAHGSIAFLRLGGTVLEFTTRPGGEPMSGFHFALEPEDFDTAFAHLQDKGLTVVTEPRPTMARGAEEGRLRRAVFRGPYGETIELRGR